MSLVLPAMWNSPVAKEIAGDISKIPGLYCGPAAVGWIAAVWNTVNGRTYDYRKRLLDKNLFPDGPRPFRGNLPGFEISLNDILRRETNNELRLSNQSLYRYDSILSAFEYNGMPIIVRAPGPKFKDGLHYLTIYKSEKYQQSDGNRIKFSYQDNGLFGGATKGLSTAEFRNAGFDFFFWGAKLVVKS